MAAASDHPIDRLQDAVDGRLSAADQAALDEHLRQCESCRRELHALQWTKSQLAHARTLAPPHDLDDRLRAALEDEDRGSVPPHVPIVRRLTPWLAAAALIAAAVWFWGWPTLDSEPARAAADFNAIVSSRRPLAVETTDPKSLETRLRIERPGIPVRVFDFGMMGFTLRGGDAHQFGRRPAVLFAYRDANGRSLVCQMYVGTTSSLPAPLERRRENDIEFLVYREGDLTVVFWQEGEIVCVLAADGDPESVIRLAVAKAVKV